MNGNNYLHQNQGKCNQIVVAVGPTYLLTTSLLLYPYSNNTMYWSDTGRNFIMQAFLDGSNEAVIAEDVDVVG